MHSINLALERAASQLARFSLTRGSVTALINRLVKAGFAERIEDPDDRRRATIAMLPRFRVEADRIYARLGKSIEAEFAHAGELVRQLAVNVIDRLTAGSPHYLPVDDKRRGRPMGAEPRLSALGCGRSLEDPGHR